MDWNGFVISILYISAEKSAKKTTKRKELQKMEIRQKITPQVIAAATGLLQPYCPDLSPQNLIDALQKYNQKDNAVHNNIERPLTRREAANLLKVSLNTISRYLTIGKLEKIKLTDRSCRITSASVKKLLNGENNNMIEG